MQCAGCGVQWAAGGGRLAAGGRHDIAEAQLAALDARLNAVRADGKGTVSLSANGGSSRNWGAGQSTALLLASVPLHDKWDLHLKEELVGFSKLRIDRLD